MSNTQAHQASTNYKEAFSLFDKRGNGRVTRDSLGDLLRACGQNPTIAEIRELEQSVGGDCTFTNPPVSLKQSRQKLTNKHSRLRLLQQGTESPWWIPRPG